MSNSETDGPSDHEWEERGELAWNEFDWERYLRAQDDVLQRYLALYEKHQKHPERIDHVAQLMGWDSDAWSGDNGEVAVRVDLGADEAHEVDDDDEPYTLHKNPIYISTKAIYLSLRQAWEPLAMEPDSVPQPLAVAVQASLQRGEEQAILAIQCLDFGDYAMAISLFKRALAELNRTLAFFMQFDFAPSPALVAYRADARPRFFDLREIWLRVMGECRDELQRPIEEDDED